jgi:hypothetical protein
MNSRIGLLSGIAAVLALVFVTFFTDWFKPRPIRLSCRFFVADKNSTTGPSRVVFYVYPALSVSSLKVVSEAEAATNQRPHALWHLTSTAGSPPVTDFSYGEALPGMKLFAAQPPEALAAGGNYRLIVESGKKRGELKFQVPAR